MGDAAVDIFPIILTYLIISLETYFLLGLNQIVFLLRIYRQVNKICFYYALLRHVFPQIISLIHCCQIVILGLYLNQFAFKDVHSTDRPEILIDGFTPGLFIFMSASILFILHMHILHSVLYKENQLNNQEPLQLVIISFLLVTRNA